MNVEKDTDATIEPEADEATSAAVAALEPTNGPEMTFKLFRVNTSSPVYEESDWCGPIWRKDCVWGYILLIFALVYIVRGGVFGIEVDISGSEKLETFMAPRSMI